MKFKNNHQNCLIILVLSVFLIILLPSVSAATRYWFGNGVDLSIDPDYTLYIDTTNHRVGIGTSSPDQKIQVVGEVTIGENDGTGGNLYLYGTTAGKYSRLSTTNGNFYIDSGYGAGGDNGLFLNYYNGGTIYFGTGASGYHSYATAAGAWGFDSTLYTSGAGLVGIGDSSPDYALDVEGTGSVAYFYAASGHAVVASGSTRGLDGRNSGTGGIGVLGYATSGGVGYAIYGQTASSSGYSGWFTGGNGVYSDGNEVYNANNCRYASANAGSVSCSSPEELTGGGCYCNCGDYHIRYSTPNTNMLTWECSCDGCTPWTYVICCGT